MRSVMQHSFSLVPKADIARSNFARCSGYKATYGSGYLIPFFVDEVLPGDTFNMDVSLFTRLATPIVPFLDNLFQETFWFFCPSRLVWDNWQRFCGEQDNPDDSIDYLVPTISSGSEGFEIGSTADYLGLPTGIPNIEVNALPFRCINLIWKEWFRDENLQNSPVINKGDGPDNISDYPLMPRCKRRDYFTSCLPWPQKGPGVSLPLVGNAPVYGDGYAFRLTQGTNTGAFLRPVYRNGDHLITSNTKAKEECAVGASVGASQDGGYDVAFGFPTKDQFGANNIDHSGLYADLSNVAAATINSLRQCFALQRFLERCARAGTRYTEILRSHFGVISPDARLQRPEFLGTSSSRININPIAQTSSTDGVTPQGNLAAMGVAGDSFHAFTKSFVEHGYIIGFINVRADLTYQQGIDRMWSRQTRYDFYWPAFAFLGEQPVYNKEIFAQGTDADNGVFGYQERWAEYRYAKSKICGKMRSVDPQSLDIWHLSQKFENLPVLNEEFIIDKPPINRVVAVPDEPEFLLDAFFNCQCVRPMPAYSVPGLIDHF